MSDGGSSEEGVLDPAVVGSVKERFEASCAGACASSDLPGVYVAPLWDLALEGGAPSLQGWKRAVLRRIEGAGAEHWGHIFLIVSARPGAISIRPNSDVPVPSNVPLDAVGRVLEVGPPSVVLFVRPLHPGVEAHLTAFAGAVERQFLSGTQAAPS